MKRGLHLGEHQKAALSTNWTGAQRHPCQFPRTHPTSHLSCLPSAPLPQASKRRQRGQWNSHQRPQTHGKEIRALGTLLPGGSEASPPAWLLSRVRVWGLMSPASSYVKCQTAGGQPKQSWPSGPHLGHVCAHTNWGRGQQRNPCLCPQSGSQPSCDHLLSS